MKHVIGLGGIFIRANDPEALGDWYRRVFDIPFEPGEGARFSPTAALPFTVLAFFQRRDDYFEVSQPAMINLCVSDLDGLLDRLRTLGVTVLEKAEDHDYGRFRWILDPEGNRIELWEPSP